MLSASLQPCCFLMLVITERQLSSLRDAMWRSLKETLIRVLRQHHPDKARGRDHQTLEAYVQVMLDLGAHYRIERTPSLRRFMALQLRHGFPRELSPTLAHPLNQFELDETVRLDNFERVLMGESALRVIDLDSPLERLHSWND